MTTTLEQDIVLAAASVEIAASGQAAKQPSVNILAYTGGIMRVGGWGDIAINLAGLDCGGAIPLLVDHDPGLDNVLGKGEAKVLIGQLHVAGHIVGSTAAARKVLDLAEGGFPLQASVGVAPEETTRVGPGERVEINGRTVVAPKGGLTVVAKGKLREVSVVTLGCDSRTSVAIAASKGAGDDDVLTAERVRVSAIMKLTAKTPEIAAKAVSEGWDATRTELEDASAVIAELSRFSRETGVRIGVMYGGEDIGAIEDGVPDRAISEGLLGEWRHGLEKRRAAM